MRYIRSRSISARFFHVVKEGAKWEPDTTVCGQNLFSDVGGGPVITEGPPAVLNQQSRRPLEPCPKCLPSSSKTDAGGVNA